MNSPQPIMIWSICLALTLIAIPTYVRAIEIDRNITDSITANTGMMNYSHTSVVSGSGSTAALYAVTWSNHFKKDLASEITFTAARNTAANRSQYQAGYFGIKYYYYSLGVPLKSKRNNHIIRYRTSMAPYVTSGVSIGRYFIAQQGRGAFDLSSDFIGINIGTGIHFGITDSLFFDFRMNYESMSGSGAVPLSGSNIYILPGVIYYL